MRSFLSLNMDNNDRIGYSECGIKREPKVQRMAWLGGRASHLTSCVSTDGVRKCGESDKTVRARCSDVLRGLKCVFKGSGSSCAS